MSDDEPILAGYLSEEDTAREIGVAIRTLQRWRHLRIGPPATLISRRPFYRRGALQAWLISQEQSYSSKMKKRVMA
jgi:hypothetical protein